MRTWLVGTLLGGVIVAATAAACGDAGGNALNGGPGNTPQGPLPSADADAGDGINTTGSGAGTGAATGLPCDVQQLLENRCIGCHLATTPYPLLTYEDLAKPAPSDPAKTMAVKAVERVKSTTAPMPPAPAGAPTPAEIATLEKWVTAGMPRGAVCTTAPGDAGTPGTGGTNYNTPTVCTSNKTFPAGADNSVLMRPGGACVTCHTMQGGPSYTVAGTVYATAHEPNDCNGVNGGLTVVVTDANGAVTNIAVNSVGNFNSQAAIAAPFKVKVTNGTKERVMAGALTAGDCNSCHTLAGVNGAPGRVMAP